MAIDHRAIILRRLDELGKSKYWLAEQVQDDPSRNSIYAFLRGDRDIYGAHLMKIFAVLEIRITVDPPSKRLR